MAATVEPGAVKHRGLAAGLLGIASALLLVAGFLWAHHWGLVTGVIVGGWAITTVGALIVAIWALCTTSAAKRLARLGLALAIVSLTALALVGVAFAAGLDAGAACGGG
jgi:hypothetical protein